MSLDCSIRAGTNVPIIFVMPATFSMTGQTFELVVDWPQGRKVYTESTGLSKSGQEVIWAYSLADSRDFPTGRIATLELQWTTGGVQDSDIGRLTVEPGISND
jgi:hypothetical protein